MNGKERILRTLARQPVDRVPIGIIGIDYDTVERILSHETYLRARIKSQIAFWEGRRAEVVQSWIEDTIALHRRLDILDIVRINGSASSLVPPKDYQPEQVRPTGDNMWQAKDGRVWKAAPDSNEIMLVSQPARTVTIEQFDLNPQPVPPAPSIFEVVDAVIAAFKDTHYILGPSGEEAGMVMIGDGYNEQSFMAFIEQPELVRQAIVHYSKLGQINDQWYIRPGTDGVFWTTDFASNQGPFISPRMFRQFCLPSIKERVQQVKARDLTVFKHACGNNWALMDMFIEAGYDAYQGIQASAGMDLGDLKRKYGDKLTLCGGVTVENLVGGTPDDVRRDVERAMRTAAPGGGFILDASHTVAYGTKYDNFMAMLDAYHEWAYKWPTEG
jgi:hypothetical protein